MSNHVYASMNQTDEQLFADEQIQRYDANTIKRRYGENWRNYASNMREIKQADGSIVRGKYKNIQRCRVNKLFLTDCLEYIIEDPTFLNEIKPTRDSTSSETASDDEQQSAKNKFAQIKAKFEKKSFTNVMASPSSSSVASSQTATRQSSSHRRDSTDSMNKNHRNNYNAPLPPPPALSTSNSQSSRSISNTSFRRVNSVEEADEEVQRIHGQGSGYRQQHSNTLTPISSINDTISQAPPPGSSSNVQYEVVDEDGNPMAIDGVHDLIKMAGVTAREVQQPDGTLVREYVIDDPNILSKFQSQQPRASQEHIPPPPPRVPLKQSMLFRPEPLSNNQYQAPPINLQQIRTIEAQRRYEFMTSSGKRIEFLITSLGSDESDIQELATEINTRLIPSSSSSALQQQQQQQQAPPYTLPKQWQPAVDLTQRDPSANRSQTTSENPAIPNNYNAAYQQGYNEIARSASLGGGMNSDSGLSQQFAPVFADPIIDWSAIRQQDPHGQIDPQFIQQFITQKHQSGAFQTSAQFLPEQPRNSPSRTANNPPPVHHQQTTAYPYQGAQQHGVRILPQTTADYNYHQQQIPTGHTRI